MWGGGGTCWILEEDSRRKLEPVFLVPGHSQDSSLGLLFLSRNTTWICRGPGAFCHLGPFRANVESKLFKKCCLLGISFFFFFIKEELASLDPITLDFCQVSSYHFHLKNISLSPPDPREYFLKEQWCLKSRSSKAWLYTCIYHVKHPTCTCHLATDF